MVPAGPTPADSTWVYQEVQTVACTYASGRDKLGKHASFFQVQSQRMQEALKCCELIP
jgi:hypothetical protein